jgi:hypothetical protein
MDNGLTPAMKQQIRQMAGYPRDAAYGRRWAEDDREYSGAFLGRINAPDTSYHNVSVFLRSPREGTYSKDRPKLILATPAQIERADINVANISGNTSTRIYLPFRTEITKNYRLPPTQRAGHRLGQR